MDSGLYRTDPFDSQSSKSRTVGLPDFNLSIATGFVNNVYLGTISMWNKKGINDDYFADESVSLIDTAGPDVSSGYSGSPILNSNGDILGLAHSGAFESRYKGYKENVPIGAVGTISKEILDGFSLARNFDLYMEPFQNGHVERQKKLDLIKSMLKEKAIEARKKSDSILSLLDKKWYQFTKPDKFLFEGGRTKKNLSERTAYYVDDLVYCETFGDFEQSIKFYNKMEVKFESSRLAKVRLFHEWTSKRKCHLLGDVDQINSWGPTYFIDPLYILTDARYAPSKKQHKTGLSMGGY